MDAIDREARERLCAWWDGLDMDRPVMLVHSPRRNAMGVEAASPDDHWLIPDVLVRRTAQRQRTLRFFGEAAPLMYVDYGASAVALQMGGSAGWTSTETIWCDPCLEDAESLVRCTRGGRWAHIQSRAIELGLSTAQAEGMLFAPYCMGAPADTAAALLGTEALLYAMVDEPEATKRGFEYIKRDWIDEFSRMTDDCDARGLSLTGWHGVWAPRPTAPIQEDFSYMIGPAMFDEFCLPHIADIVDAVPYSFYHLDGVGALRHLPSLCSIGPLRAIQWQPGAGHGGAREWLDVARVILRAGKRCQLYVNPDEVDEVARELGSKGLMLIVYAGEEEALRLRDRWGLVENSWTPCQKSDSV